MCALHPSSKTGYCFFIKKKLTTVHVTLCLPLEPVILLLRQDGKHILVKDKVNVFLNLNAVFQLQSFFSSLAGANNISFATQILDVVVVYIPLCIKHFSLDL